MLALLPWRPLPGIRHEGARGSRFGQGSRSNVPQAGDDTDAIIWGVLAVIFAVTTVVVSAAALWR
jgi:hypothetical protein